MSKILIILNPAARSTRAGEEASHIGDLPGSPEIALTSEVGEARALAAGAMARGFDTVVAAGGDGTINEVVNGLVGTGATARRAAHRHDECLRGGTRHSQLTEEAWALIQHGQTREIDLAVANSQYFVQLAGVGLDAQVVKETSWAMKRNLGPLSYVISAAQIAARKPPRLVVRADGRTLEGCFVLIGNGRYYGGPLAFFKKARVDDGRLDVLVFQKMGYLDIARYMGNILMGSHAELEDVHYFQASEIIVTSDEIVPVEVDGELATELPVTFRLSSRKLEVLAPPAPPA